MKVLVAGDFCPRDRVATSFEKEDYSSILREVRAVNSQVDYSIVNFECAIIGEGTKPISKIGPLRSSRENGAKALLWSGFNCVTLANNHFYDYGEEGVRMTLDVCKKYGIDTVGGGMNIDEASTILYRNVAGKILAVVNCCEHEFSIATKSRGGSNPLNPVRQYYAITEAKSKADYVLVIVHGGHEFFQLPSPRMVETYRFFIDTGADAVVNHHQHCYSGYEIYNGKPIFYGLGNFCFDNPVKHEGTWTKGYMVTLEFGNCYPLFVIHPYIQCAESPCVELLQPDAFDDSLKDINRIIENPDSLEQEIDSFYAINSDSHANIFEPVTCRYYLASKRRGWLPSLISDVKKLKAKNYIYCESHRDILQYWLDHK